MTTSTPTLTRAAEPDRRLPALGGFAPAVLGIELRRVLRNRRTLVFTLVMPAVFFLIFGLPQRGQTLDNGRPVTGVHHDQPGRLRGDGGHHQRAAARWPPSGRWVGAGSCGSPRCARPRTSATKVATAMTLGLLAVVVEFAVGAAAGVRLPAHVWLLSGLAAWVGSLVFAAFGLFVGYLVPAENVMQFLGPILAVLAMFGGLFVPLEVLPHVLQQVAKFTPVYGIGELARAPADRRRGERGRRWPTWSSGPLVFGVGAARLFRRDTARV